MARWVFAGLLAFAAAIWLVWQFGYVAAPAHEPAVPVANQDLALADVAGRMRLEFVNDPGPPTFFFPEIMGGGVAIFDANGDGRWDVFFRGAAPGQFHPCAKKVPTSRLFLAAADGTFRDATIESKIHDSGYGMGAAVGDVNNDGRPDLYLTNYGPDAFYANVGNGLFIDISQSSGVKDDEWSTSACFFDFDRDGFLDLYICNYGRYTGKEDCKVASGRRDYCHPLVLPAVSHRLFHNITPPGAGPHDIRFEDVTQQAGILNWPARGLGVQPTDTDNDGWPDLYVANDSEPNFLWHNQRNGHFCQVADAVGVAVNSAGRPQGSMGIAESDFDGDGLLDFAVTNLRNEYTALYLNSTGSFYERSTTWRLAPLTRPYTGFGIVSLDIDGDGQEELIQVNGKVVQAGAGPGVLPPEGPSQDRNGIERFWSAYREPGLLLVKHGAQFADATGRSGDFGRRSAIGRCLAAADLDGDGRAELVATELAGPAAVYQFSGTRRGNSVSLRAIDPAKGGRDALGALVMIKAGAKSWLKRIQSTSGYLTAHAPEIYLGLGDAAAIDSVLVIWPDGSPDPEAFAIKSTDRRITLRRGEGSK